MGTLVHASVVDTILQTQYRNSCWCQINTCTCDTALKLLHLIVEYTTVKWNTNNLSCSLPIRAGKLLMGPLDVSCGGEREGGRGAGTLFGGGGDSLQAFS